MATKIKMDQISNAQLLFDRQESFNDVLLCLVAITHGQTGHTERLEVNLTIIDKIAVECKKRGFDPAKYGQVKDVLNL